MSGPERIALGDIDQPAERPTFCPGALLVVDRAGYRDLQRNGVQWATDVADVPIEGKATARVACVASTEPGTGRCASCAAKEKAQRQLLKAQRGER